jgi:hypothetical protein
LGRAVRGLVGRAVSTISSWVGSSCEGGLESGKIIAFVDVTRAGDGYETIFGSFLRVFVNETTGVNSGHISAVEGGDFFEFPSVGVATIFGKATMH